MPKIWVRSLNAVDVVECYNDAPADQIWKGIYAHRRQSSTALQFTRHKTLMLEGLQFARYARFILRIYF
jgi:hypothetical protein